MADEMGLTLRAAQGYDAFFVPAIFAQWPPVMLREAGVRAGEDLLDVGCGTGVLCREALSVVNPGGSVTGVDLSDSMLTVARQKCAGAVFQQGNVAALPFADESFDVVTSAFMLMFVPDQTQAIAEMWRVLRPGGRLITSVWQALADNPVYSTLVDIASNRLGKSAAESISWPFSLGEPGRLSEHFESAGIRGAEFGIQSGQACFQSVEELVRTEFEAWLLADSIDERQLDPVLDDARTLLASYEGAGEMRFPFHALFATARKF